MDPELQKTVYLSFASEDAHIATNIADILKRDLSHKFGIDVAFRFNEWSPLSESDWTEGKFRRRLANSVLFIPIISKYTQASRSRHILREWALAFEHRLNLPTGVPYVVPLAVDGTKARDLLIPWAF